MDGKGIEKKKGGGGKLKSKREKRQKQRRRLFMHACMNSKRRGLQRERECLVHILTTHNEQERKEGRDGRKGGKQKEPLGSVAQW